MALSRRCRRKVESNRPGSPTKNKRHSNRTRKETQTEAGRSLSNSAEGVQGDCWVLRPTWKQLPTDLFLLLLLLAVVGVEEAFWKKNAGVEIAAARDNNLSAVSLPSKVGAG